MSGCGCKIEQHGIGIGAQGLIGALVHMKAPFRELKLELCCDVPYILNLLSNYVGNVGALLSWNHPLKLKIWLGQVDFRCHHRTQHVMLNTELRGRQADSHGLAVQM